LAVRIAALTVAIGPLLAISADARGPGGGGGFHGGGGFAGGFHGGGFGGGFSGGGFGGVGHPMIHAAPMIHTAPMIHASPGIHSLSGFHSIPRIASSRGLTAGHLGTPHIATAHVTSPHTAAPHLTPSHVASVNHTADGNRNQGNGNVVTRSVQGAGHASALRNNAFASLSTHNGANRALANATFHGRFAGQNWHNFNGGWWWHNRFPFIIVIGWWGPVFWPWAWWDFVDYTFWPYAYDTFWPYAYDDLYWGLYGPYAYPDPAYVSAPSDGRRAPRTARVARAAAAGGEVCSDRMPALTDWPIEQIAKTVEPDQAQQAALNDLKDATAQALDVLKAACPTDLPSTPTGRLAAMRKRIEAMLQGVGTVRPVLERFYDSLTDEQKQRFNAVAPQPQLTRTVGSRGRVPDLTQVCSVQAAKGSDVPTQRIEQALHPTEAQRSALDALNDATMRAADTLKANCPADETLTPPGRIAAMEQRLNTMLEAIKIVQPTLENFYGTLTDEQKARFNELGAHQS